MDMLATLTMWILAAVAVATFGAIFLRRVSRREPASERLHHQNPFAAMPAADRPLGFADLARVPLDPSKSSRLASDDANDALDSLLRSPPIAVSVPLSPDAVGNPPASALAADEAPPQTPASGPVPGDNSSSDSVSFERTDEQIPLPEKLNPVTSGALGGK